LPHFATVCHVCDNSKKRAARSHAVASSFERLKVRWHESRFIGAA